jgi:hypothetical protein
MIHLSPYEPSNESPLLNEQTPAAQKEPTPGFYSTFYEIHQPYEISG